MVIARWAIYLETQAKKVLSNNTSGPELHS